MYSPVVQYLQPRFDFVQSRRCLFCDCLIPFHHILSVWGNYSVTDLFVHGDGALSLMDSTQYFPSSTLFLSKSVIPALSWMSCHVNSAPWISCCRLQHLRLATRRAGGCRCSWGRSCCVSDCYPWSVGLCPFVTDWYLARSPSSKPTQVSWRGLLCTQLYC